MWYIIMAVFVIGYFYFVKDFINALFQMKQEHKARVKTKGIIYSMDEVKLVSGISDIDDGSKVSIYLFKDKITINDKFIIPLNRVMEATTFKVGRFTIKGKTLFGKLIAKKIYFLSIKYINKQGQQSNGLFFTGDKSTNFFADAVNKQINFFVKSLPYKKGFERTKWS